MPESPEKQLAITTKEIADSASSAFKSLQIPESILKSVTVYQAQIKQLTESVNLALMPMMPSFQAIGAISESISEVYIKLQPVIDVWAKNIQLPPESRLFVPNSIVTSQFIAPRRYPDSKEIAREVTEQILKIIETKKLKNNSSEKIPVILSKDGELSTSDKHRHPLQNDKSRLILIRTLSHEYLKTQYLVKITGYKNADSLYKTIQSINQQARNLLKIKIKLIVGKRGSGYKFNPKIKVQKA